MARTSPSPVATPQEGPGAGYLVDRVVICDAYREPDKHYKLLPGGKSKLIQGRRPSMRYKATAKATKGGIQGLVGKEASLLEEMTAAEEDLNEFVNALRDEVQTWRHKGYPGTAIVTRRLLEWWFERDEERQSEHKRLFFCQQEAVETVIYLYEVKGRYKMPETGELLRYALKLATGAGKTFVMGLLIVWSTLHKRKVSGSTLSANFLILVPNLTVRDRVWGTDPLTREPTGSGLNPDSPENLFADFDMVPPDYKEEFRPNIQVRNWQSIPLEVKREDWISDDLVGEGRFIPASVLWTLQRRQRADPRTAVRKILGKWRDVLVINDEAHHVYGEKKTPKDEDPGFIRWSRVIESIGEAARIPLVVDLSATPWYGSGSPKPEGTLFEWLVSEFSVYDAFESGLVKVVRLPEPGEEGYQYLNLWDYVSGAKTKEEYLSGCKGAIASIYSSWKEDYLDWEEQLAGVRVGPSPVMLVVADKGERAKWLFEHLTSDYELLRNPNSDDPSDWVTIQVDSKVFDAEKGKEGILREMVNTVGKDGKSGEDVRCIVSVNMLSEGWDVKNVSHIIGLRAFGSPLLTEQVIGRGLRRVDYTSLNLPIEERLANPNRADEETVDAFGIPFVGFPVERRKRPKVKGWTGVAIPIAPDEKKARYEVSLPNVRSWAIAVSEPISRTIDLRTLPELVIDGKETPSNVRVKPVVGGTPVDYLTLESFREEWPLIRSKMLLARDIFTGVNAEEDGLLTGPTFEEVLEFVSLYVDTRVSTRRDALKQDIGIYFWLQKARDILETAVRDAPTGTVTVPLFGEPRELRTGNLPEFKWPAIVADGKKSHWSKVPCHTDLERQFADFLDGARDVVRYAKNERLGFSITYYENRRPRQYFPDFAVVVTGSEVWWLAETKGEIRPNTILKREAADLWCERMTRSGQGEWKHLFVPQKAFEKATAAGVKSFAALVGQIVEAQPRLRPRLMLISDDDPQVERERFKTLLPVYSLEAAAGYFGDGKAVELEGWIEVEGLKKLDENMFVARAIGRSMEPTIYDGDYLVFRAHPAGTRQGKTVLARGPFEDPELDNAPYTVKKYSSEKTTDVGTGWRHTRISLSPLNREYEPIHVESDGEDETSVQVVAEYIGKVER
jgi:type III restriction enzyme